MKKYQVMREHHGERFFRSGDLREAAPSDVAHLVARGVLAEVGGKSAPATENKVAAPVQNKAARVNAKKDG